MNTLKPALLLFSLLSLITGIGYPLLTTLIGKTFFPHQSAGSLIIQKESIIGSELIGQSFASPRYFWGRLSATTPMPYNAQASSGSNLSATNPALGDAAKARVEELNKHSPKTSATLQQIPVDLITASASGLDPEISPEAAYYQIERIAHIRHISEANLRRLIADHTNNRQWGLLGEPRVNVLKLNLALDALEH